MIFRLLLTLLCSIAGCVSKPPWETHPMPVKPDYTCFTGPAEAGCDVYIWSCLNNEKVIVHQCGTAFIMPKAKKETTACHSYTDFERKHSLTQETINSCEKSNQPWP